MSRSTRSMRKKKVVKSASKKSKIVEDTPVDTVEETSQEDNSVETTEDDL